jgi:hypothetical protein
MSESAPQSELIAEWVEKLREPQTRRFARQKLIEARAVAPLLECLQSANSSVVWAAVVSLGELKAPEAVEPLITMLERGTLEMDVCDSLARITGKDLGADPRRWRAAVGAAAAPTAINAEACIAETAEYLGVRPSKSGGSYQFKLSLADGRTQRVAVFFDRRDADSGEMVVIYSECGPAAPKYFEAVLRKNLSMPCGAFAVRDIDGTPQFVMVETLPAAAASAGTLARKIEQIAARADQVEKLLTQEDRR